jgi:hypothetical protein
MRFRGIGTAAAALALALPATAAANTWTVEPGGTPCTNVDGQRNCPSIQAAHDAAANADTISVRPGSWPGATISKSGLTLTGTGVGQARVTGTLFFTGSGALSLQRLVILPTSGAALEVSSQAAGAAKTVDVQSSILSGTGSTAAIKVTSALAAGTIAITSRHVTIADSGSAPATAFTQSNGGAISATFFNSIVKGPAPGATIDGTNDTTTPDTTLFASPSAEDFRLRVGSPAIDQGGQGAGEITEDIDGQPRGPAWDRGADEFVNHPPTQPTLTATKTDPQTGEAVGFVAQGEADPDGALGDRVNTYRWVFGDGTTAETTTAGVAHAFAAAGTYQVRVQAVDTVGAAGPQSDPVTVTATAPPPPNPDDGNTPVGPGGAGLPGIPADPATRRAANDIAPPLLAIASPRAGQRVRLGRATPTLRGRATDESGVRRVELALVRFEGRRCLWYDGRGTFRAGLCTAPRWFRAVLDDFAWRYAFPPTVRPRPGAYRLAVRAADFLGHASTAPPVVSFRYVP